MLNSLNQQSQINTNLNQSLLQSNTQKTLNPTSFNLLRPTKSQDSNFPQRNSTNEIISKSIVYGSIAFWLGKKSEQNLTHKWCVYVRGNNNEDISYFIKEVTFTLHSTFENNVRTITKWPYELYASGWGEFDIKITIILKDEAIKPIEFIHFLKLYPPANQTASTKKPIVSEFFDEIVFVNPKKQLRDCLMSSNSAVKKETSFQIPIYNSSDEDDKIPDKEFDDEKEDDLINKEQGLENKLEGLSIAQSSKSDISNIIINNQESNQEGNNNIKNMNSNDDIDMENLDQNQSSNINMNLPNNESVS